MIKAGDILLRLFLVEIRRIIMLLRPTIIIIRRNIQVGLRRSIQLMDDTTFIEIWNRRHLPTFDLSG